MKYSAEVQQPGGGGGGTGEENQREKKNQEKGLITKQIINSFIHHLPQKDSLPAICIENEQTES